MDLLIKSFLIGREPDRTVAQRIQKCFLLLFSRANRNVTKFEPFLFQNIEFSPSWRIKRLFTKTKKTSNIFNGMIHAFHK